MRRLLALLFSLAPLAALTQPANPPAQPQLRSDQKLEQAVSVHVISQIDRSVQPEKTIPESATAVEPLARIRDDLYIERRLLPKHTTPPAVAIWDPGTFVAMR
jgi:hypothetical protein